MRNVLWMGVEQFTQREAQVKLYEHLLSLSLRFHIGRKTGEVLQVMDRGTGNIDDVIRSVIRLLCIIFYFGNFVGELVAITIREDRKSTAAKFVIIQPNPRFFCHRSTSYGENVFFKDFKGGGSGSKTVAYFVRFREKKTSNSYPLLSTVYCS
jgi:ABC-type multidrug transport system fused ATPase/permease subunit